MTNLAAASVANRHHVAVCHVREGDADSNRGYALKILELPEYSKLQSAQQLEPDTVYSEARGNCERCAYSPAVAENQLKLAILDDNLQLHILSGDYQVRRVSCV